MATLVCTVGLPRSGKSTWARGLLYPIVCPDSIRLALHGQEFAGEAEEFVWAIAKVMVRSLFNSGHEFIVLDATNTTRARRNNWKSSKWQTKFVEFDADVDLCLKRAGDNKGLCEAIERMADQFEPLMMDEEVFFAVDSQRNEMRRPARFTGDQPRS